MPSLFDFLFYPPLGIEIEDFNLHDVECKIDVEEKFDEFVVSSSALGLNGATLSRLNVTNVGHLPESGIVTSTVINDDVQSIVNSSLLSMTVSHGRLKRLYVRKRLPGKFHLWEECKSYTWHSNQRLPFDNCMNPVWQFCLEVVLLEISQNASLPLR